MQEQPQIIFEEYHSVLSKYQVISMNSIRYYLKMQKTGMVGSSLTSVKYWRIKKLEIRAFPIRGFLGLGDFMPS